MSTLKILPKESLRGTVKVQGDKSISHRIAMLGALAKGDTSIEGFLMAEDCINTLDILEALGVSIEKTGDSNLIVHGRGLRGLREPGEILDAGNSGTTMRLMTGILSAQPFFSVITGDSSLRKRPMARIIKPLTQMGAAIWARANDSLPPIAIKGGALKPIQYSSPHASAQIKSSILLAGLQTEGITRLTEPFLSRDHTERMFRYFGIPCFSRGSGFGNGDDPGYGFEQEPEVFIEGGKEFPGCNYRVPGDFSAAAFFIVAALLGKHSEIIVRGVGLNPTRRGLLDILVKMGARIDILDERDIASEPVADLRCKTSNLTGVVLGAGDVPRMIDEFPILFLAATQAEGDTVIKGAHELRVKESDRIATMALELRNIGAQVEELEDGVIIKGPQRLIGGPCSSHGDHRVAMTMAVAGKIAKKGTIIENWECVNTSFPGFLSILESL